MPKTYISYKRSKIQISKKLRPKRRNLDTTEGRVRPHVPLLRVGQNLGISRVCHEQKVSSRASNRAMRLACCMLYISATH